jgi:hypothetical protein
MAVDPYRMDYDPLNTTQPSWIRKDPRLASDMGSTIHRYQYIGNIGIDPTARRWPLRPLDLSGMTVYMTADRGISVMTHDNYMKYSGITLNPQFDQGWEQILEKNAEVIMPVGHEIVVRNHMVQCDDLPAFTNDATDVVRQHIAKPYMIAIKTAVTAAVNLVAGYAAGISLIAVDTIAGAFGLQVGDTISITTGGILAYYLIRRIGYIAGTAGAGANIELAWPLSVACVNNDVISTQQLANAPIFFPADSEYFEAGKEILNCIWRDQSGPTYTFELINPAGVVPPAAGVSLVQANFGAANAEGFLGIYHFAQLDAGDILHLLIEFFDDVIRPQTVGKASTSQATIRTSATVAATSVIELKC